LKKQTTIAAPEKVKEKVNAYAHLSICIAVHTSERGKAIASLLPSLPAGVEICVVFNERIPEDGAESFVIMKDEPLPNGGAVRFAEWRWERFSFADARNHTLDLATREWIMWLDADELLAVGQFSSLANLVNVPRGVAGLLCTVAGLQPSMYQGDQSKSFATPQPRIIRNDAAFRFRGHCHEQVMWSIQDAGYQVQESPIVVVHTGYVCSRETMVAKMERNVALLIRQCYEWDSDDLFFTKLLFRDLQNLLALKEK